jgi:hypothetical protein
MKAPSINLQIAREGCLLLSAKKQTTLVCHASISDSTIWSTLRDLDRIIAEQVQAEGCPQRVVSSQAQRRLPRVARRGLPPATPH